jgi:hypothetical protein
VLGAQAEGATIPLDEGRQELTFVAGADEGITDVRVRRPASDAGMVEVCGVRFHLEGTDAEERA